MLYRTENWLRFDCSQSIFTEPVSSRRWPSFWIENIPTLGSGILLPAGINGEVGSGIVLTVGRIRASISLRNVWDGNYALNVVTRDILTHSSIVTYNKLSHLIHSPT